KGSVDRLNFVGGRSRAAHYPHQRGGRVAAPIAVPHQPQSRLDYRTCALHLHSTISLQDAQSCEMLERGAKASAPDDGVEGLFLTFRPADSARSHPSERSSALEN